jgi:WD40 repeat protein
MWNASSYFQPALKPSRTIVTSFTPRKPSIATNEGIGSENDAYEEGDWVLNLSHDAVSSTVSCALSNGEIQIYDQERLHPVASYCIPRITNRGSSATVLANELAYGSPGSHLLLAACSDGRIVVWDWRQSPNSGSQLHSSIPAGQAALTLSMGYSGALVAVGSDKEQVHFFDLRYGGNPVGSYTDAHTLEVTQVRFVDLSSSTLVSAGEDGLACLFDTRQATEETAMQTVLNVRAPVRRIGFCGNNRQDLYVLTGNETASIWDLNTSTCKRDFGYALRHDLGQAIHSQSPAPMDYLVDAKWDGGSNELQLVAGTADGNTALFRLTEDFQRAAWQPCHALVRGHRGVVRAWAPLSSSILLTAGEDARLCEWNRMGLHAHSAPSSQMPTATTDAATQFSTTPRNPVVGGGGPVRRANQRQRNKTATDPY